MIFYLRNQKEDYSMFISREKFEQMEEELKAVKLSSLDWKNISLEKDRELANLQKSGEELVEYYNDLREKYEYLRPEYDKIKKENKHAKKMTVKLQQQRNNAQSQLQTMEKFADELIEEKLTLRKENQQLKDANSNLYTDYLDTIDDNDLLQDSLSLSIEALGESQKQINILKQAKDILSDDLNKAKYERDYYKELYYREGGY